MLEQYSTDAASTCLRQVTVGAYLTPSSKKELFTSISRQMAVVLQTSAGNVMRALTERERRQNTALPSGWALCGTSVMEAKRTAIGVFTLRKAMEFRSPDRWKVDVVVVVAGPLHERALQLQLKQRTVAVIAETNLLERLRSTTTEEEVREVLDEILHIELSESRS
jgi:mannitol/fructose-specific phosphotransferase system IIA component (Ntr-type)